MHEGTGNGGWALQLDERGARLSGVKAVESFDEAAVVLDTLGGALTVHGEGLSMARLDLDRGEADVSGRVDALEFGQVRRPGGFWKGLLR